MQSRLQVKLAPDGRSVAIDTGVITLRIGIGDRFPFHDADRDGVEILDPVCSGLRVTDERAQVHEPVVSRLELQEHGPVRATVRVFVDDLAGLDIAAELHFFAESGTIRVHLSLLNPARANHPNGIWTLGQGGSVFLKDVSLDVSLPSDTDTSAIYLSETIGQPWSDYHDDVVLYQDSSGGSNWHSPNHVNRHGERSQRFCGYRLTTANTKLCAARATPIIALTSGDFALALTMQHFWQNFPKSITGTTKTLSLGVFPGEFSGLHELQGGEQKTHVFHVALSRDDVTAMEWCRAPMAVGAGPQWFAASQAVPYLSPESEDPNTDYVTLVRRAIEGEHTFENKRESIDEYGWRNFGDLYADHETVFHKTGGPMVSHYNNQYDAIRGFAIQYMRSGDFRWHKQTCL